MLAIEPSQDCQDKYQELRSNKHRYVIFHMPNDSEATQTFKFSYFILLIRYPC